MTRQEEIRKAVDIQFPKGLDGRTQEQALAISGFELGVKWADNNPKSPWIKAKNELPTKGGHYLCMDENRNISTLAFKGDRWVNTTKFFDVPLDVVEYWMPIPKLPKE